MGTDKVPSTQTNDIAAALALGLGLSSIFCCCTFFTGVPAVVVAALSFPKASSLGKGFAITGAVTGSVGVVLGLFSLIAPDRESTPRSRPFAPETTVSLPAVSLPPDQQAFCEAVSQSKTAYDAASNDLKKSAVRRDRKVRVKNAINSGKVNDWVGNIQTLTTNGDGKAVLVVSLPCSENAAVGTWNNAFSDIMDDTLIDQNGPLYDRLSNYSAGSWGEDGTKVRFSGAFLTGPSTTDGFTEMSMSEMGSMTDPTYLFKFSSVEAF